MEPWVVALLAAGIPALVAAVTFVVGEILKTSRENADRRAVALARVFDALERVPIVETRPRIFRRWLLPDIEIVSAVTRLYDVLPRHDRHVILWLAAMGQELSLSGPDRRVVIAAEMQSRLIVWRKDPRKARPWFESHVTYDEYGDLVIAD